MRVLLTGASSFVGVNLIQTLEDAGIDQIVNLDVMAPLNAAQQRYWQEGDILDLERLKAQFAAFAPTHVIHLAARTDCDENTTVEKDYFLNTDGTANVLAAIKATDSIERVIITSTQYVCGPGVLPEHDEHFAPHTVYGQSKVESEKLTREAGLDVCWTLIRPVNLWGPWHQRYKNEFWRVLQRGLYLHPAGAPVERVYGYIGNVNWQILQILKADRQVVDGEVIYVGDLPDDIYYWTNAFSKALRGRGVIKVPRPLLYCIGLVGDVLGLAGIKFPLTRSRYRSMTTNYLAPTERTHELFGAPPYSLEDGVAETVDWLRSES